MGSSSSKFRKHLQNGDEVAALNVYNNHSDLRKGLDPNCSYGDNFQHETPLHFAARHGMKSLLRIFLFEHCGNPNKTNGKKETALHCVCMEKNPQYYPVQRRRLECLNMMLQWRGAELKDGEIERVDLAAVDEQNNTALHYAALSGLKSCVEVLVNHSCPLFVENKENHTPCDCAESNGYSEIALYLESKMVFSNDGSTDEIEEIPPHINSEEYSGLRAQDLQEAKDQLLVETADMLSIPLFTAEALLRNHEWSREMLLDAWMANAVACCEKSGVSTPANLFSEKPVVAESLSTPTMSHPPSLFAEKLEQAVYYEIKEQQGCTFQCDICTQAFQMHEAPVHMSCHQFCRECWEGYLNVKIQEGGVHDITCPGFDCNILVPVEVIENVVSRDMARRYLQFDIKAFVDSNPNIKWCPFPGCGRAVKLPEVADGTTVSGVTSPRHSKIPNDTSRAVDCGNGHYFCWECVGEAHEPCSCESLQNWQGEIKEIKPETLYNTEQETESAANCLWLVTNSKSCPNCKSPIQKNEGCNHMKCSKCKYDFCWVCLDQWKRHNSSTGGYFKCNRYEVSKKVDDTAKQAVVQAVEKNTKMQELNKFVHYYTRYKNHENSYKLEEPLLKTAKEKMLKLAEAVTDLATARDETKFVEEAVHKLLKARRVLKYSYVYGYYLDGPPYRKIVFEFMQTELEECTEILSQMVNRLYLRTPRKKIIEQSQICHRKRLEFLTAISKGLVPPETPPGLRKKRRKYSMDTEDEDLKKAILASIEDFDPENPWIVDASGRHTNVAALLDWPSDDSDDSDDSQQKSNNNGSPSDESGVEKCLREGCSRSCAKNPRTGEQHNFCSLRCSRLHKQRKDDTTPSFTDIQLDEQMDFLRALEMSRLQYLKEQGAINEDSRSELTSSGEVTEVKDTANTTDIYSPAERLDIEIKRLLELSSIGTEDIDDIERKLSNASLPEQLSEEKQAQNLSRFGENQSTIVSRVPNKSVEDLYHPDCSSCQGNQSLSPLTSSKHAHQRAASQGRLDLDNFQFDGIDLESLGACGGVGVGGTQSRKMEESENQSAVDDIRIEGQIMQKLLNMDKIDNACSENVSSSGSGFGVIKDISVSNILVEEDDKTKHFAKKDLSNLAKSKSRVTERGSGRLFAANTPGEDEKVFSLISPESDFSESSSSEVWGFRPQIATEAVPTQTPETDSSIDGCSYADLPNQNMYYRHDDSANENSPIIAEEAKLGNVIGSLSDQSVNQISISEMTENLLQMTLDMQDNVDSDKNTQSEQTVAAAANISLSTHDSSLDEVTPSGHLANKEETTETSLVHTHIPQCVTLENEGNNDCSVIDLDHTDALSHFDEMVVSMETTLNGNSTTRETTIGRETTNSDEVESRSTFV